jgi:hypothetical protein
MKNQIISGLIILVIGVFAPQITQAQETTYLSSLGTSTGSPSVGSDYWLAALFFTGNNVDGYVLNSIQLAMTDASGNPIGFTAMIYSATVGAGVSPGSSLGTLDGSANPSTSGIYTYTDDSSLILSPSTDNFIVLTAGTTIANGAYAWSESAYPPSSSGGWSVGNGLLHSSNGISGWNVTPYLGIAQFAINGTAVPEPSASWLVLLGSGIFIYVHNRKRHSA